MAASARCRIGNGRCRARPAYGRAVGERGRVVMVGTLRGRAGRGPRASGTAPSRSTSSRRRGTPRVEVAVTSGVWGVRAEHLDRLPGLAGGRELRRRLRHDRRRRGRPARYRRLEHPRRAHRLRRRPAVGARDRRDARALGAPTGSSAAASGPRAACPPWPAGSPAPASASSAWAGSACAIAHRLEAFDATISYHNRRERTDVPYAYAAQPARARAACDVLVVAAAGGAGSRAPGRRARCSTRSGRDGYLVNVARGSVVDEHALVAALEDGRHRRRRARRLRRRAARAGRRCSSRDDVVLLPHVGSATVETRAGDGRAGARQRRARSWPRGRCVTPVAA